MLLLISKLLSGWQPSLSHASSKFSANWLDELSSCNTQDDDEWEESFVLRLFSSCITSLPCVDRGDNSWDEEARERGISSLHGDALRMIGHTGKWGTKEALIWMSSLTGAHSRSELECTLDDSRSYDVHGHSSQHTKVWYWWQPNMEGWSKELIMHDVSPRSVDW